MPYRSDDNTFATVLVGTVARSLRAAVRVTLEPNSRFFAAIDAGVNAIRNEDGVKGNDRTVFVAQAQIGFRWSWDRPLRWAL